MARGTIPNNDNGDVSITKPWLEMVQELDRVLAITVALVPNEALSVREVIGPVPVNAISEAGTITQAPGRFAGWCPGVPQVQIAMKMGFVKINNPNFALTELLKVCLKGLNVRLALLRLRFAEQLLTLFPTELIHFQERA